MKHPHYNGFTGWLRSVHSEGTPDSWSRWSGSAFLVVVIVVVVMCLFGHQIGETLKNMIVELSGIIFGGAAVRKGIEVGGEVVSNWRNPQQPSDEGDDEPEAPTTPVSSPTPQVAPQVEPNNAIASEFSVPNFPMTEEILSVPGRSPKDFLHHDLTV